MHHPNGILIASLAHQVLGRLVNLEEQEAGKKHEERQATDGDDKVPPAHVLLPRARLVLLAREVAQQGPRDQGADDLGDGPVDGEDGEEVLVRGREELEEYGRVHREVAADAKGPQGVEDADGGKVWGAGGDEAPDGGEAEGEVEGPFASDWLSLVLDVCTEDCVTKLQRTNVTAETPEHGPC